MVREINNNLVCSECIGETYLSDEVERHGRLGICSYCSQEGVSTYTLEELAGRIAPVFLENWSLTPDEPSAHEYALSSDPDFDYEWEREGEAARDLIESLAAVTSAIAADLTDVLDERYPGDPRDPDFESPFDGEARYILKGDDPSDLDSEWEKMKQELHHRSRFFSKYANQFLSDLFENIQSDLFENIHNECGQSRTAVRVVEPHQGTQDIIYRARVALTMVDLRRIVEEMHLELGPPTGRTAKAGRMNANGISVFYGAFDRNTCLAEVRPPVGSKVVMGKFELLRPVRLLDLAALEDVFVQRSYFDLLFESDRRKCAFLRTLSSRFSMPVMPGGEDFDYLLTQVVCEYLGNVIEPQLDGIIFPSAQGGEGSNVTFFNRPGLIESSNLPKGTTKRCYTHGYDDTDELDISLWVELPQETPKREDYENNVTGNFFPSQLAAPTEIEFDQANASPDAILRLLVDEIEIIQIGGISYHQRSIPLGYYERQQSDRPEEF